MQKYYSHLHLAVGWKRIIVSAIESGCGVTKGTFHLPAPSSMSWRVQRVTSLTLLSLSSHIHDRQKDTCQCRCMGHQTMIGTKGYKATIPVPTRSRGVSCWVMLTLPPQAYLIKIACLNTMKPHSCIRTIKEPHLADIVPVQSVSRHGTSDKEDCIQYSAVASSAS